MSDSMKVGRRSRYLPTIISTCLRLLVKLHAGGYFGAHIYQGGSVMEDMYVAILKSEVT
jgi:hypothetical protein